MFHVKRRRTLIRLISFVSAGFVIALGFAVTGLWMAYGLRKNIEYSYQRSLSELTNHVGNISLSLQKAKVAGTSPQLVDISSEIRTESSAAKASLSQIAVTDVNFENTSKFLSQVGDYSDSLTRSLSENQKVSAQDRDTISRLATNSAKLSQQLSDLVTDVQSGKLTLFKSDRAMKSLEHGKTQSVPFVQSGFQSIEDNLSGLPTLIYDGPFSDNVLKKLPEMTKGKPAISAGDAKNAAARFLGVDAGAVKESGSTAGSLPTYNFESGTKYICVAKNGGYIVRTLDSRTPVQATLDAKAAAQRADAFLKGHGYGSMAQTYYLSDNNICVINYAYMQGDVMCYTDLVKVGVALDTGDIVTFDATGFIMNHKNRTLPAAKISAKEARSLLSPGMTVQKESVALIPTGGTAEKLCYEFKCKANNTEVIDYFNVETGAEEQILILEQTPGGTLAM